MKKTAKVILRAFFAIALIASVGFLGWHAAAASKTLTVTAAEISSKSDGVTANIAGFENNVISTSVIFNKVGDKLAYKLSLKNSGDKKLTIQSVADDNSNTYIDYSYNSYAGTEIAAGESFDFVFTATYKTAIPNSSARNQNLNVTFNFAYAIEGGETAAEEIKVDTPNTGDGILNFVGIFVLSVAGLALSIFLIRSANKKIKTAGIAVALVTVAGVALPMAATANDTLEPIKFESHYTLMSRLVVRYNDGAEDHEIEIENGDTLDGVLADPQIDGYDFGGWQNEDGSDFDPTQPVTSDINIHPVLDPIHYVIEIDVDGDGDIDDDDVVIDATYGEPVNLPNNENQIDGHTPNGWKDSDGNHYDDGEEVKDLTTEDGGTISLEPDFILNQFTVNLDTDGDGDTDQSIDVTYGETATLPDNENQKEGHTPNGWTDGTNHYNNGTDLGGLLIGNGETVNLVPDFTPNQFTVNLDTNNDGQNDQSIDVTYGETATLPDNENQKEGHTPNGWTDGTNHYDDGTDLGSLPIANGETVNLTPDFTPNHFVVNLDTNNNGQTDQSFDVTYGETANLPDNTGEKPGYAPNGWTDGTNHYNNGADVSGLTVENGGQITISADWTLETYDITYQYYSYGGGALDNSANPTTYTIEDDVTFVAPTVEGYRFVRWSIPRAGIYGVESSTVSFDAGEHYGALTVYGWYEQRSDIAYTVKHYIRDINGAFSIESSVPGQGKAGDTLQVSSLKKSMTGYKMLAAFDIDSGTTMPASGSVTSTTILANGTRVVSIYYRPYELKIKYNLNGGSLGEGNTVYSSKDGYLTPIGDPENTEFLAGVYGSKVTLAYATGDGINIEKRGHYVSQSYQWAVGPEVGAFAFEQGETGEDAQGFYYQDLSSSDKTMTMYLDWTEEIYMINYYEAVDDSLPTFYTVNRQITIPALTTNGNGQYFDGWTDNDTGEDLGMSFTIPLGSIGRRNFRAHWHAKRYHIVYDGNGGTGEAMATTTCNYNASCTLESNTFAREYYDYAGWTINGFDWHTLVGPITIDKTAGEDDETFTAYVIWEPYPEVQYLGNGSDEGEMGVQKIKAGEEVTLLAPNFSRNGYGFVGWNTKADGTGTLYGPNETINQMPSGGLTLYAMWLEAEQGVTMQTFDKSAEPYASYSPERRIALRDERDGNVYVITKLTNDVWWMAENLRLNPNDANTPIDEFNTNNPAEGFAEAAKALSADELWSCGSGENCSEKIGIGLGNIDRNNEASPTAPNRNSSWYGYGVMYNYYTAVAGNKKTTSGNADGDICPSGWHIPTGGAISGRDYYLMYSGATSGGNPGEAFMSAAYRRYAYNLVFSGSYTRFDNYGGNSRGSIGRYWSSTQQSGTAAYLAYLSGSSEKLNGSNYTPLSEYAGYAVRCIANTPTTYSLFYEKGTGANAATNMPASQTVTSVPKRHVFTISSTIPELEGYTFLGWGLIPDGTDIVYQPGDELVSVKIGVTLYTRWEQNGPQQYQIQYDGNGGTGTMGDTTCNIDENCTLAKNRILNIGYRLTGWKIGDTTYAPGAVVNNVGQAGETVVAVAQWEVDNRTANIDPFELKQYYGGNTILAHYDGVPDFDEIDEHVVSKYSEAKTYAWSDGAGTLYYWTENGKKAEPYGKNNLSGFFASTDLEQVDLTYFDVTNINNFAYVFRNAASLKSVDISTWEPVEATSMASMFEGCTSLESVTFSENLDTSHVTTMAGMFYDTPSLKSLDVSMFDTSSVAEASMMFYGTGVKNLSLTNFDVSGITDLTGFFSTAKIEHLDVSGWVLGQTVASLFVNMSELKSINLANFDVSGAVNQYGYTTFEYWFAQDTSLTEIDLSGIILPENAEVRIANMFYGDSSLETIYVSSSQYFKYANQPSWTAFEGCVSLKGGNGTTYDSTKVDKTYARIDMPNQKGYFTDIADKPVEP